MSFTYQRSHRDSNHGEIVDALTSVGASVVDTSAVGKGFPDAVVGYAGRTVLVEIKRNDGPPSARKLRSNQAAFLAGWRGGPIVVVDSIDAALRAVMEGA